MSTVALTIAVNLFVILKNLGNQLASVCKMIYMNRKNLFLKINSLAAPNHFLSKIMKFISHFFKNIKKQDSIIKNAKD